MSHRGLLNIVLLVTVAMLALLAFFEPGKPPAPESRTLTQLSPADITQIHLQRKNLADVSLAKTESGWQIEFQGNTLPANTWRIESLLELARATVHDSFDAKASELDKYGLAQPRARLRFNEQEILIGDNEPIQRRRYVYADQQVHTITDVFYQHLFAEANNYISLSLLPDINGLQRITLPAFTLIKENGDWTSRPTQNLSAEQTNTFIDEWRFAQAMEVTPSTLEQGEEIIIEYADGREMRFLLHENQLIRPDLQLAYHFTPDSLQRLLDPKAVITPE